MVRLLIGISFRAERTATRVHLAPVVEVRVYYAIFLLLVVALPQAADRLWVLLELLPNPVEVTSAQLPVVAALQQLRNRAAFLSSCEIISFDTPADAARR